MSYIVVDIGCIECGQSSKIVGVYENEAEAEAVAEAYGDDGSGNTWGREEWWGRHDVEVFEWPAPTSSGTSKGE